ncbi:MAG: GDP-mannose 4,6-dehydratase [Hyphomicrobiales bacterium]|nr:GDP-mannose 4,6-dehydratase [Hyphomicrobiales bacterium]
MNSSVAHRRILITGADGFVGSWILHTLEARPTPDLKIIAGGRTGKSSSLPVQTVRFDITDPARVDAAIARARPSTVIHLAAVSHVSEAREDPHWAWEVNLRGTMNLAESVMKHSPQSRFVFVSSSEVYGGADKVLGRLLDETALLDPRNPYAAAKAAADLMIGQMAGNGLNAIRVRPFNHTGPGQTERFVIPAFAAQVARIEAGIQEPVIRVGNLEARRDFLDVRDVANAYISLALSSFSFEPGLVLNLASGTGRRIGEIVDELVSLATVEIRVETDPSRLRVNETPFANADAGRIRKLLGWQPRIPWSKTLADVLEFWRARVKSMRPVAG